MLSLRDVPPEVRPAKCRGPHKIGGRDGVWQVERLLGDALDPAATTVVIHKKSGGAECRGCRGGKARRSEQCDTWECHKTARRVPVTQCLWVPPLSMPRPDGAPMQCRYFDRKPWDVAHAAPEDGQPTQFRVSILTGADGAAECGGWRYDVGSGQLRTTASLFSARLGGEVRLPLPRGGEVAGDWGDAAESGGEFVFPPGALRTADGHTLHVETAVGGNNEPQKKAFIIGGGPRLIQDLENADEGITLPQGAVLQVDGIPGCIGADGSLREGEEGAVCTVTIPPEHQSKAADGQEPEVHSGAMSTAARRLHDIKDELKKLTKQDLQDAAAKITPQQIAKVPPGHIKAAIEAMTDDQFGAILATLKKNQGQLGPMVAQLTEEQLQSAVEHVRPSQKEIATKELDLNNKNSPLASIVNQNISEKKREVIKSNAPKGDDKAEGRK